MRDGRSDNSESAMSLMVRAPPLCVLQVVRLTLVARSRGSGTMTPILRLLFNGGLEQDWLSRVPIVMSSLLA